MYNNATCKIAYEYYDEPSFGKEFFELVSLAVSAVKWLRDVCKNHEQSVLASGGTE